MDRIEAVESLKLINSILSRGSTVNDNKFAYEEYIKLIMTFDTGLIGETIDVLFKKTSFFPSIAEISETYEQVLTASRENKKFTESPDMCYVCMNEGFIIHKKDGMEYVLYCTECENSYKYDGTEIKNHKSKYYSEPVTKYYDTEALRAENMFKPRGKIVPMPDNVRHLIKRLTQKVAV